MKNDWKDKHRYADIINLPHHVSKVHPQMACLDRAAQFSPFAALTGYDGAIKETARLTNRRLELDEAAKTELDAKLKIIEEQIDCQPEIEIIYFQPDEKKSGGEYISTFGIVKKIDKYKRSVLMQDGIRILISEIIGINGEIFASIDNLYEE